jgi:hypothetical protein
VLGQACLFGHSPQRNTPTVPLGLLTHK